MNLNVRFSEVRQLFSGASSLGHLFIKGQNIICNYYCLGQDISNMCLHISNNTRISNFYFLIAHHQIALWQLATISISKQMCHSIWQNEYTDDNVKSSNLCLGSPSNFEILVRYSICQYKYTDAYYSADQMC